MWRLWALISGRVGKVPRLAANFHGWDPVARCQHGLKDACVLGDRDQGILQELTGVVVRHGMMRISTEFPESHGVVAKDIVAQASPRKCQCVSVVLLCPRVPGEI